MIYNKIEPNIYYTPHKIYKLGYFTWAKGYPTVIKWIEYDMNHSNILKTVVTGDNRGTRYLIKGENIINFITKFEDGSFHLGIPEGGDNNG